METQDFDKELLAYIYGDMTAEEKKEFEQKLSKDSNLREEFEALSSVRQELGNLSDKEVMEPFSTWGRSRSSRWFGSNHRRKIIVFRPVTAVAASLLILMLVGFLTDFSISINDKGLFLGFGNQLQTNEEKFIGEDDILALIRRELDENNNMLLTKLTESENSYNNQIIAMEFSLTEVIKTNKKAVVTNEDLQKFFTSAENKNTELIREYLKLTSTQQQDYFKTMLTQFNDYMLEQRSEDLTMIRNSLIELKQSQNVQKQETDQVIASILTSVNQQ